MKMYIELKRDKNITNKDIKYIILDCININGYDEFAEQTISNKVLLELIEILEDIYNKLPIWNKKGRTIRK